ncbi:transcriptional regulator, TetR family [Anaerosporobacter mobilis DSM 15930]|jgi:AcrR family transcriptional regulator|uniref:Transcriptional regulator, TetR family n=1 Tax=Anaerosporobacter mobilis DSM 15930 TaxID=1120996 RepID=A0A1M7JFJ1_9FIRM|nr:TetR/AcrR family transcriptional regulator [Anaerosporobacter mobilis]SHM51764.1 transcriptional regulator, TetR family [Anaerosporobacter mobilis DSM 15930]
MGRNKYPEQTQEKIVEASIKLFIEKGYEQTTIQDILDALNLSKGGLYHHFKSKEEILEAVKQKRAQYAADMLHDLIDNTKAANAKEKLKKILYQWGASTQTHSFDTILSSQSNNPHFVMGALQNAVNQDAPIISKLIEEGVKDGSIQTTEPALCAEIFLLLLNFWTSPVLFKRNLDETKKRLSYLQSLMCLLGLDIIDNEFIENIAGSYDKTGMF